MAATWTLRGHCRVINGPNFNIVESQGIGRPEEKERDEGMGQWSSQNTHFYGLSFLSYMDEVHGASEQS